MQYSLAIFSLLHNSFQTIVIDLQLKKLRTLAENKIIMPWKKKKKNSYFLFTNNVFTLKSYNMVLTQMRLFSVEIEDGCANQHIHFSKLERDDFEVLQALCIRPFLIPYRYSSKDLLKKWGQLMSKETTVHVTQVWS